MLAKFHKTMGVTWWEQKQIDAWDPVLRAIAEILAGLFVLCCVPFVLLYFGISYLAKQLRRI